MTTLRLALFLVATSFFTACGPTTSGEACDLLGDTLCKKCFPSDTGNCVSGFRLTCCTGTACTGAVKDSGKVLQCNDALSAGSCASLINGNLPAICTGVAVPK